MAAKNKEQSVLVLHVSVAARLLLVSHPPERQNL